MALQECGLNLDNRSKELQPHGSVEFPCAGYATQHTNRTEDVIPWHWHEEIEIGTITQGQMTIKVPTKSFLLTEGDLVVINSNILHYGIATPECQLHTLVFSPKLITGTNDSVFATKYLRPLLTNPLFSAIQINSEDQPQVLRYFDQAFKALATDCYGYEFIVREQLSRICLLLRQQYFNQPSTPRPGHLDQDSLRIKKMLAFIHTRFGERISLLEIAGAADISERECLRCFKKTIHLSPIQYLLKYRVMRGAELLLSEPADSVIEIATNCGFDSPSNFSKTFKRFYKQTPRDYRRISPY